MPTLALGVLLHERDPFTEEHRLDPDVEPRERAIHLRGHRQLTERSQKRFIERYCCCRDADAGAFRAEHLFTATGVGDVTRRHAANRVDRIADCRDERFRRFALEAHARAQVEGREIPKRGNPEGEKERAVVAVGCSVLRDFA